MAGILSFDCPCPKALPQLDSICRTLPTLPVNSAAEQMYQFEDLSAVLDEDNRQQILDNLKD
jgi:hypothetical protein